MIPEVQLLLERLDEFRLSVAGFLGLYLLLAAVLVVGVVGRRG